MAQELVGTDRDLREWADVFKALADETRLTILAMLQRGEMCVCEILEGLPLTQPAVSHHLKILRRAGLIQDRRKGKWVYYSLDPELPLVLIEVLSTLLLSANDRSSTDASCK